MPCGRCGHLEVYHSAKSRVCYYTDRGKRCECDEYTSEQDWFHVAGEVFDGEDYV